MEIEQKANKVIRPASIYTLSAEETNQITTELQNVITAGGLTPSNSTLTQVRDAIDNLISDATTGEWQKPADWVDIRSGALPNSVYFLAAHKKDYSAYSTFSVFCTVKNSGTYDVYVDGIKYATTASGTSTVINWQTLNLDSGYDVTYPQELRTHIVRVTQSDPTKNLDRVAIGEDNIANKKSVLWAHFNMSYTINTFKSLGDTARRMTDSLLEAITSNGGVLKTNAIAQMIAGQNKLKTIPIIDMQNSTGAISYFAYNSYADNLKKVHIRNLHQTVAVGNSEPFSYTKIKEVVLEDSEVCWWHNFFGTNCENLVKIPEGLYHPTQETPFYMRNGFEYLEDTVLDFTPRIGLTQLQIEGSAGKRVDGLKGVTVSSSAPFTGGSPQISLKYTGLDRGALIGLFNSMPTVTNSQVCDITGATGAADLTAADLAIATNKGWTVTR